MRKQDAMGDESYRVEAHKGSVQSLERAFGLIESIADHGGRMGLSQLAAESRLPLPTIHRLVRTLVELGYLRQDLTRQYVLAPKLIRLGDTSSRMLATWARPHLERIVNELGESANLAMLDGDQVVYVAHAQSRHSVRMFTEVGSRVMPHCTAVGKAILATMPPEEVRALLKRTGMPKQTETTFTEPGDFMRHLASAAEQGYATDEGEQEIGVRCIAVAVPNVRSRLAISISGPASRMSSATILQAVPVLTSVACDVSVDVR
jgi:IclR family transcriptional regulator, acetate operon repressor